MISAEAMLNYLESLKGDLDSTEDVEQKSFEVEIASFKAEHERNLAHYEAQQLHSIELFRSVIAYGQAALKSEILINGGAAVALLAFIGNIWTKGIQPEAVNFLTSGIAYFSFGVLAGALGTVGSYFTQYCYSESFLKAGVVFHFLTVLIVLGVFVLFSLGAFDSYQAFVEHLSFIGVCESKD